MIWFLFFVMILWMLVVISNSNNIPQCPENYPEQSRDITPRGIYGGGVGYPIPFLDPLLILAGIAFIAFLIQTIHAIYYLHNHGHGLVGGLVDNVLPNRNRELLSERNQSEDILKAIEFYELIHRKRKKKKKKGKPSQIEDKEYIPITFHKPEKKT